MDFVSCYQRRSTGHPRMNSNDIHTDVYRSGRSTQCSGRVDAVQPVRLGLLNWLLRLVLAQDLVLTSCVLGSLLCSCGSQVTTRTQRSTDVPGRLPRAEQHRGRLAVSQAEQVSVYCHFVLAGVILGAIFDHAVGRRNMDRSSQYRALLARPHPVSHSAKCHSEELNDNNVPTRCLH